MKKEIIELAIRSPKIGVNREEFILAKNAAVKKLVSINGIGPEREFEPFNTMPKKNSEVFVGMTKYASQGKVYRAMFSFGFISKLMKFMKKMDAIAGVFIQPTDETFDYLSFSTHQNITEIALLRPKKGIDQETFLKARATFLKQLDAEQEVEKSYTFNVTGGFKGKDTFPHFTVYKNKEAFDNLMERAFELPYVQEFFKVFDAEIICFCKTIK
ncbi:MAG: hypothetical protein KA215_03175 [Flavobacterium sp.]|nr:hypothetical protein [Sphingobacteriales bacterium]MBP6584647.1 hypothetical protein [Flavobacterium sp.]